MPNPQNNWVRGLDSLRFLLAGVVMLSHIENPMVASLKHSFSLPLRLIGLLANHLFCGAAAVIVFFVISGFVIHHPFRNSTEINVLKFLVRRWVRIGLPLLVVGVFSMRYSSYSLIPVWSLYCELIYYTIYPVLRKLKLSWREMIKISYALSIALILAFVYDQHRVNTLHIHAFFEGWMWYLAIAVIHLPCWLLGVQLAAVIDKITDLSHPNIVWLYRVVTVPIAMLLVSLKMHMHINYTYTMIFFALWAVKWVDCEIRYFRKHGVNQVLEYFGKFSYSLYLCHRIIFSLLSHFFTTTVRSYIPELLIALGISYLFYVLVEHPSHKLARRLALKL